MLIKWFGENSDSIGMNILFLTLGYISDISERGIYTDLMREFIRNGHSLYIVVPAERRFHQPTE